MDYIIKAAKKLFTCFLFLCILSSLSCCKNLSSHRDATISNEPSEATRPILTEGNLEGDSQHSSEFTSSSSHEAQTNTPTFDDIPPTTSNPYGYWEIMDDGERVFVYNSFQDMLHDQGLSDTAYGHWELTDDGELVFIYNSYKDMILDTGEDYPPNYDVDEDPEWVDTPESSVFTQIGYNYAWKELYLCFKSSGEYAYYNVPFNIWEELKSASSKGGYFYEYIKNRFDYDYLG